MSIFLPAILTDAWNDLLEPSMLWQLGTIALCGIGGWLMARAARRVVRSRTSGDGVAHIGVESFVRVLTPVLTLLLILAAKPVLQKLHHVNLLRIAIPLVGSLALIRFGFYVARRAFDRAGKFGGFLELFEKGFALLVWIGVVLYLTGWWPDLVHYLDTTVIPIGHNKTSLLTILQAIASVAVTLLLAMWAGATLEHRLMRVETIHSSLRAVMARMGKALLVVLAVLISLSLVGIDLTVLSVFGGALGVGLGLGLQKIASNYVSGFVILLERSMAIGDMVTVDKYYGKITQINTRYTVVRSLDGIEAVVPNEMFVSSPVQNYSLTDRSLRLATQLTVGYETDLDSLLPLLERTVAAVERVSADNPPAALLMKFGADGLDIEIGFWIADPENGRTGVVSEVNKALWKVIKTQNITIPYPQREIRVISESSALPVPPAT